MKDPAKGALSMRWIPQLRYMFLLVALVMMLIAIPLGEMIPGNRLEVMLGLVALVVPILAVSTATDDPRHRRVAVVLASFTLLASAARFAGAPSAVAAAVSIVFLAYTIARLVSSLVATRNVTSDVLAGAFAGFLLIGLTFAVAYGATERLFPGSIVDSGRTIRLSTLTYFSYITMLSIGFGDVVPVHSLARMLAVFEGLIGLAFNTLVISVLVANRMSSNRD